MGSIGLLIQNGDTVSLFSIHRVIDYPVALDRSSLKALNRTEFTGAFSCLSLSAIASCWFGSQVIIRAALPLRLLALL